MGPFDSKGLEPSVLVASIKSSNPAVHFFVFEEFRDFVAVLMGLVRTE